VNDAAATVLYSPGADAVVGLDRSRPGGGRSRAAITTAASLVIEAESGLAAAAARIQRSERTSPDSQLKAPRERVQVRVASPRGTGGAEGRC